LLVKLSKESLKVLFYLNGRKLIFTGWHVGVEGVEVDMAKNMVTVKGIVNPYDICDRLRKRTMRNAIVISPPPPPPTEADVAASPKEEPVIVHSQVNEVTTVELLINMHCEACAQQLHKKILKMRGVQSAEANHDTGKLNVTGTMSTDSLIQYIHRRTGKLATVVPLPLPLEPTKEEELKEDGIKKPMESQEIQEKPPIEDSEDRKDTDGGNKEEETAKSEISVGRDDTKAKTEVVAMDGFADEEMIKRMMYWPNPYKHYYNLQADGEAVMPRMMPIVHPYPKPMMPWMTQLPPPPPSPMPLAPPMYHYYNYDMVERQLLTPQYFSDENPNACVIS
jgi:copper chaperone CopZ